MEQRHNVLLINGSPKPEGCISRAFDEIENTLHSLGIDTQRVDVAAQDIRGCMACMYCRTHGKCVFDDIVNRTAPLLAEADGLIVGTPTYYAGSNGSIISFLDHLFYSTATTVDKTMKVGAAVVSSRRAGSTSAFDEINKYFTITSMPIAASTYWNEVHGYTGEDVEHDLEGLQTMRNLARNMAFLIRAIADRKAADGLPEQERGVFTSFFAER